MRGSLVFGFWFLALRHESRLRAVVSGVTNNQRPTTNNPAMRSVAP